MTPREFLDQVVRPNVADFHANYGSLRHGYNAVAAVDALAAHIIDESQFSRTKRQQYKLAYSDQHNMTVIRRKVQQERRIPTPTWANNPAQLQIILVRYMEQRACVREGSRTGTLEERLHYAEMKLQSRLPSMREKLHEFIREYKHVQERHIANSEKLPRLEEIEKEIKNIDAQIRLVRKPGGVVGAVAQCIHLYYGLGWDSVDVVNEIMPGLHPMWVHQVLYKLNHNAEMFLR